MGLADIETGHYGVVPEHGSSHGSMAPRGCHVPEETPGLDLYTLNEMSEIWSENAAALYDEAVVRQGEWLAPTEVEKTIFRLCMQDEARHVAYGVKHLQYFLERHPEREPDVHKVLDLGEQAIFELTLEPQTSEPRAILAGGGLANIELGMARMAFVYRKQVREYLDRLKVAGLKRESCITIPWRFRSKKSPPRRRSND